MEEYYSAELSQKINRGMTENALKCKYNWHSSSRVDDTTKLKATVILKNEFGC